MNDPADYFPTLTPERTESTKLAYAALLDAASAASPIGSAVLTDRGPDPFAI